MGTVPMMAGHSAVSLRRKARVSPKVERSMIDSAPMATASRTFCISMSRSLQSRLDAQVHVDLGLERKADAVGVEGRVVHVGGDHGLALGDERAQGFGVDALLGGDGLHLRGDDALAGGVHLGGVGHGGLLWG